eukprot:1668160-Pleurochrysis_carterae.AAC.1
MASGGKPPANTIGGSDALNPSPPTFTPTPVLLPRTGLQSRVIAGGTSDEATGSVPVANGQCYRHLSAPQRRAVPSRSSSSCISAGPAQQSFYATAFLPPLALSRPPLARLRIVPHGLHHKLVLASKGHEQRN